MRIDYYTRLSAEVKEWCRENQDELIRMWEEYLSEVYCSDSLEHYSYISSSENCYWEFCEEKYHER